MTLKPLTLALFALSSMVGVASAQEITPDGHYVPAPQAGTVIDFTTYTTPTDGVISAVPQAAIYSQPNVTYYLPGTTTYSQSVMTTSGSSQFLPSSLPGSTLLNGTTQFVTTAGTTVVGGTRRVIRRGLGVFRR